MRLGDIGMAFVMAARILFRMSVSQIRVPGFFPGPTPDSTFLLMHALGAAADSLSTRVPGAPKRDLDLVSSSYLQPGPALGFVRTWRVTQQIRILFLYLSAFFQINHIINMQINIF